MWFKYLVIPVHDQKIRIGLKYNENTGECVIGGQKRFLEFMKRLSEEYFLKHESEVIVTFPQTYKIRISFVCEEEQIKNCKELMRAQTDFCLLEVSSLKRTMR